MRIIDKNTDYYDFWQNIYRDDSIVFDRTDSYLLKKDHFLRYLRMVCYHRWMHMDDEQYTFLLLQVCNTFWLILVEITEVKQDCPEDYSLELIATWKNYDKSRCMIKMDFIRFDMSVNSMIRKDKACGGYDKSKIMRRKDTLVNAVDWNAYRSDESIEDFTIYKSNDVKTVKHIPLLKACGIAGIIDSHEIYLAFEEYFSLEKTAAERTESVGLTDVEKIGNHGFDIKTSFRG